MLREQKVPYVCALRSEGRGPAALGDDRLGAFLAVNHLIDSGHRRIAMLNGPTYASNARGRFSGFMEAHREAGIRVDDSLVQETDFTVSSAADGMCNLISQDKGFTACFAATDNIAIGAMSVLSANNIRVPDDISIIGYNDIPMARHLPVPLSTVRIPFNEIADNALMLLGSDEFTDEVKYSNPELVLRASTRALT